MVNRTHHLRYTWGFLLLNNGSLLLEILIELYYYFRINLSEWYWRNWIIDLFEWNGLFHVLQLFLEPVTCGFDRKLVCGFMIGHIEVFCLRNSIDTDIIFAKKWDGFFMVNMVKIKEFVLYLEGVFLIEGERFMKVVLEWVGVVVWWKILGWSSGTGIIFVWH